MGNYIF